MDDLISREVLLIAIGMDVESNGNQRAAQVLECILNAPAVAAAPVVHARWKLRGGRFRCTNCDERALLRDIGGTGGFSHEYEQVRSAVCPSCGARMDLPEGEEARDDA